MNDRREEKKNLSNSYYSKKLFNSNNDITHITKSFFFLFHFDLKITQFYEFIFKMKKIEKKNTQKFIQIISLPNFYFKHSRKEKKKTKVDAMPSEMKAWLKQQQEMNKA